MPEIKILSKSHILSWLQCPKRLWLEHHNFEFAPEDGTVQVRLAEGFRVGETARGLFPGGILVEGKNMAARLRRTKELLRGHSGPLYEATFRHRKVRVMTDILLPGSGGYTLIEVKSGTSVKDYYLQDIAIQAWVLQGVGLTLRRIELAVIDSGFIYLGRKKYRGLFVRHDMTQEVWKLLPKVAGWVTEALNVLALTDEPGQTAGKQCGTPFACPFQGHCAPETEEYSVELLPNIGKKAAMLRSKGIRDIRSVPPSFKLTDVQSRVLKATKSGRAVFLSAKSKNVMNSLPWPRYFMDFETVALAVPEWAGTQPYQQIPFQWSCHVEAEDGALRHDEFLADGRIDPRRAFAEKLIAFLGKSGPVLVYHAGFEKRILSETAASFPDLARKLNTISGRIFDLLPVARQHYYHPEMRGSWSLKSVLPTIAPKLAYDGLSVKDGLEAQETFGKMRITEDSKEREALRQGLLKYCERDTYAIVVLAKFFSGQGRSASFKKLIG